MLMVFVKNTDQADRMTVLLADVTDLRADRSILLNANEHVIVFIVAVAKQLYEMLHCAMDARTK